MKYSKEFQEFLHRNRIIGVDKLSEYSYYYLTSLKGFTKEIGHELKSILSNAKKSGHLASSDRLQIVRHNSENDKKIGQYIVSNRLYNIINNQGYQNSLNEFVSFPRKKLMKIKNFGVSCLNEVFELRKTMLRSNDDIKNYQLSILTSDYTYSLYIPKELLILPFRSIFSLLYDLKHPSRNIISKLIKNFSLIGDLDSLNHDLIINIEGFGTKTADYIFYWFDHFHFGVYKSLYEKFEHTILHTPTHNIVCSIFLRDLFNHYRIIELKDFNKFDDININDFSYEHKIGLLELRTLYLENNILRTRTNHTKSRIDLISDIELFFQHFVDDKSLQLALRRWNHSIAKTSLQTIGDAQNLTRERIRQLRNHIIFNFKLYFVESEEYYLNYLVQLMVNSKRPLSMKELISNNKYQLKFKDGFYLSFISEVYKNTPTKNFLKKSAQGKTKFSKIRKRIYNSTQTPFSLKLNSLICFDNLSLAMLTLHAVFIKDGTDFVIAEIYGVKYVNRRYYSKSLLIKYILESSRSPLSTTKINEKLEKLSNYLKKKDPQNNTDILPSQRSIDNTHNLIMGNPTINAMMFGFHVWGTNNHYNYMIEDRKKIQDHCVGLIKDIGHQVSANYLFNNVKNIFPKLANKYELANIIKQDKRIKDLKFLSFNLKSSGQENRILIKNLVVEILEKYSHPISSDLLLKEIRVKRSFEREGMTIFHKQIDGINLYRPAYYGLEKNHYSNIKYLSKYPPYIEKYINWRQSDSSIINEIISELKYEDKYNKFITLINNHFQNIKVISIDKETPNFIINSDWSIKRMIVTILASTKKKLLLGELKIILSVDAGISIKSKSHSKNIRYLLNQHPKLIFENKQYFYSNVLFKVKLFYPLLDEVEDILTTFSEYIDYEELYYLFKDDNNYALPETRLEFLTLLSLDNRFEIFSERLVGLTE